MTLPVTEVLLEGLVGARSITSSGIPLIFLGDGLYWTTAVQHDTGSGWLSMTPQQGYDDATLRVVADTSRLAAGSYTGRVNVVAPIAINTPLTVRVTLRLREPVPSTLRASASTLTFSSREGDGANPAPQNLAIRMEGETAPEWTVAARTLNGGPWLTVTPSSGSGNGEVTTSVKLGDLPAGIYAGQITITSPKATNPTLVIPVSYTVTMPKAIITAGGIFNAATFAGGPVAPGQLATIVGDHLGPATGIAGKPSESTGRFATSLGGARILFDDVPAPVLFASKKQVNVQVPFEVAGKSSVKVRAESAGFDLSEPIEVAVADTAPGMFSVDGRRAAALHLDYSLNSPANPVAAGDILQLFLTGQGLTTPRIATGAVAPATAPFALADQEVVVLVNGQRAEVLFAGMAPGTIGLLQVNVRIPANAAAGDNVLLGARIGSAGLPAAMHIAVKAASTN